MVDPAWKLWCPTTVLPERSLGCHRNIYLLYTNSNTLIQPDRQFTASVQTQITVAGPHNAKEWLKDMILNLHSQVAYHQAWDVASGSRTKSSPAMTDASVRSFCWGLSPANRMKWTAWSALGRWGGIFASCLGAPSCFSRTWVWGKSPKQKMVLNVMTNFQ